ncbi:MAG: hypothetical protein ACFFDS_03830 [Candidatus Thorarchaeota archaeon]
MSEKEKEWRSKEIEHIEFVKKEKEEEEKESDKVKINWSRIAFLGFITAFVFSVVDLIIILIFLYGFDNELIFILYFMQYVIYGEAALVVIIGACLGNFGQSTFVSSIKQKLFGSDPLSKESFREATFNSFTYYFGGGFLVFLALILWQVMKLMVNVS